MDHQEILGGFLGEEIVFEQAERVFDEVCGYHVSTLSSWCAWVPQEELGFPELAPLLEDWA